MPANRTRTTKSAAAAAAAAAALLVTTTVLVATRAGTTTAFQPAAIPVVSRPHPVSSFLRAAGRSRVALPVANSEPSMPPPSVSSSTSDPSVQLTASSVQLQTNAPSYSYLRWQKDNENKEWGMQTAVSTFERFQNGRRETVQLTAQLHFGSKDYFRGIMDSVQSMDSVHYELLVDESLVEVVGSEKSWYRRRLKDSVVASQNDQELAQTYGWECQMNVMDYVGSDVTDDFFGGKNRRSGPEWIHADYTRQEFLLLADEQSQANKPNGNTQAPLWSVVSPSSQTAEAISALVNGPPTLAYNSKNSLRKRLFTNLFLSGHTLTNQIRSVLWFTVPTPEMFVLLLDYSSIFLAKKKKGSASALDSMNDASDTMRQPSTVSLSTFTGISDLVQPIWNNVCSLQLSNVRRLIFGQTLMTSNTAAATGNAGTTDSSMLLIQKRNEKALRTLEQTLAHHKVGHQGSGPSQPDSYKTALLYGSSHCPDLQAQLEQMGFRQVGKEWRTAWSVSTTGGKSAYDGSNAVTGDSSSSSSSRVLLAAFVLSYLAVGALDWVGMFQSILTDDGDWVETVGIAGLYLLRHVALYLGLSKFLMDWEFK